MNTFIDPVVTRRLLLAALAASGSLYALPGCASETLAPRSLVSLVVFDRDSGQVLPTYVQHGRQFVPGRPGARYALRLRNLTAGRVLVVLSVDGVNVISGQTAGWGQTGYVLDPGRAYDINGWRKSDRDVAAFAFAPVERSYAALTGRPDEVGVIGMAVFREHVIAPPVAMAPAAPAAPTAAARERSGADDSASSRLGTAHGAREESLSRRTSFERASSTPDQLLQLEYDTAERLIAAGVMPGPVFSGIL